MEAFKYGCVVSGANFCPRPDLSKQLSAYIASGQNVVIQGERRMGKTSLVHETISGMRGWRSVDVDFMGVKSIADVCSRIADAIARFDADEGVFRKALSLLAHLRPFGSIDPNTGLPTITLDARASSAPTSVTVAIDALAELVKNRKTCVVFDEFQDILYVDEGDQLMALMRGRIQFLSETAFVFLGSARNDMMSIFMSPKSPFYKSAISFSVDAIPAKDFFRFAAGRFESGKRKLPEAVFLRILEIAAGTSGDVQELCDAMWQVTERGSVVDDATVERGIETIFNRERTAYAIFMKPLTDLQARVLRALAKLGGEHVLSVRFLESAGVANPTSVKRALESMAKFDLVYCIGGEWRFVSPFFREWLRRN